MNSKLLLLFSIFATSSLFSAPRWGVGPSNASKTAESKQPKLSQEERVSHDRLLMLMAGCKFKTSKLAEEMVDFKKTLLRRGNRALWLNQSEDNAWELIWENVTPLALALPFLAPAIPFVFKPAQYINKQLFERARVNVEARYHAALELERNNVACKKVIEEMYQRSYGDRN